MITNPFLSILLVVGYWLLVGRFMMKTDPKTLSRSQRVVYGVCMLVGLYVVMIVAIPKL